MLAGFALPFGAAAQSRSPWLPGLQLYTVRDAISSDLDGTLRKLADIGYRTVEPAGLPGVTARVLRARLERYKLTVPSMHASYDRLRGDFDAVLEEARILGAEFVVCPWIDARERKNADAWKTVCQTLSRVGQSVRDRGLALAYHNHDFEFVRFKDGTTPFDLLTTETDPRDVKLELDVYWVAKAGLDPVRCLKDRQDRVLLVHLKDLGADGSTMELGRGVLDFEQIIRAALAAGARQLFVEQDTSADPMASIRTSYQFLERLPSDIRPQSRLSSNKP